MLYSCQEGRFIEQNHAIQQSKLGLLALDWAKPFDSIMPDPMVAALRRFSLPAQVLHTISAMYDFRSFFDFGNCFSDDSKVEAVSLNS